MTKLKPETIIEETQREAIVNRPHNLAGSVKKMKKDRFSISSDKIEFKTSNTIPALLKLFMEAMDNPIDVAIKGGCNLIQVNVDNKSIRIRDNGYGLSSGQDSNGEYIVYKAFCKYNTSSNYSKEVKGQGQKGVNGIGIKLCTTLSTHFKVISDDGVKKITLVAKDNNFNHEIDEGPTSGKSGVEVQFKPDFNLFDAEEIDQEHIDRMYEYTLIQALTYPDVTFKFNNRVIKYTSKKFLDLFQKEHITDTQDDYFVSILPNDFDDFKQVSYINGLETYKGGTHIDFIMDKIVAGVRAKLVKKHKTIKPGDIRNKLQLVLVGKSMKNIDWEGQTKSEMSTPNSVLSEYFSGTDFDKFIAKILKNDDIILPITEYFTLKEQAKINAELKKADKKGKKKPKSEKFMPPIGKWTNCFVCEGDSAANSISKLLGRQGNGFYAMFGVPLNAYAATLKEILKSVKMIDLKDILGIEFSKNTQENLNFDNIVITTDYDLPGHFIAGQLVGLLYRFGPNLFEEGRVRRLVTPLMLATDKKENIVEWFYTFEDYSKFEKANKSKNYNYDYKKGLGSWDADELDTVIKKDGLENMIEVYELDEAAKKSIEDWLGDDTQARKDLLSNVEFDMMSV